MWRVASRFAPATACLHSDRCLRDHSPPVKTEIAIFLKKRLPGGRERAPSGKPKLPADLKDQLEGIGDALARQVSVTGTFNSAALFGLGASSPIERTAKAAEETAKNTKRLADAAVTGGLTFA